MPRANERRDAAPRSCPDFLAISPPAAAGRATTPLRDRDPKTGSTGGPASPQSAADPLADRLAGPATEADWIDVWTEAMELRGASGGRALSPRVALLLRIPGESAAVQLASSRLLALADRARQRQIAVLLSVDPRLERDPHGLRDVLGALDRELIDGISLRADPGPEVTALWRAAMPQACIGRSCHGETPRPDENVDWTSVAPIFAPNTEKRRPIAGSLSRSETSVPPRDASASALGAAREDPPRSPLGVEVLRGWTQQVPRVIALGGLTPSRVGDCWEAGASGIAAIRLFFGPPGEVFQNLRELAGAWFAARSPSPPRPA